VALSIYFYFDPTSSPLFPRCPFYALTGYLCPGCGTQRAIHALLHGNIPAAYHFNALLLIALPYIAILLIAEATRKTLPRFYTIVNSRPIIWFWFIIIILWWLIRNVIF
jgi:hypothetical protein